MEEENQGVAYNMSLLQIQEVFRLLYKSNALYLKGDFGQMVHTLKCCKLSVIQNLTKEERKLLADKEEVLKKYIQYENFKKNSYAVSSFARKKIEEKFNKELKKDFQTLAEDYKTTLMDILEAHNYLVKKMEDIKQLF